MADNIRRSWWWVLAVVIAALLSVACGSDGGDAGSSDGSSADVGESADGGSSDTGGSSGSGGSISDAPAAGQATVSVDGLDLSFELAGNAACTIVDESVTYAYRIGDNEVTLAAGLISADGGWAGSISLTVANPEGEAGPIAYYPAPGENGILDGSLVTIDGDSVRYEGPMLKQPANDGSQPPPVDVGTGRIVATC